MIHHDVRCIEPRGGASGSRISSNCDEPFDAPENSASADVAQARIELLREEIIATVSPLIATLEAALAMTATPDDAGMIYALRTAKAYWRCASANAAELVELREASR